MNTVYVFGTCMSLFQERYMGGYMDGNLLCITDHEVRAVSQDGVLYNRLMHINEMVIQPSPCTQYCYGIDIGNTDGLTALMNINEQMHNVIP